MILEVLMLLVIVGVLASGAAMVAKVAPMYTSLMSFGIWVVVGYGATSIDLVTDAGALEEAVATEPALAVLAFGNAALSFIVMIATLTGNFETGDEHGTDRPVDANEVFP